jgi:hypothetical protein
MIRAINQHKYVKLFAGDILKKDIIEIVTTKRAIIESVIPVAYKNEGILYYNYII